MAGIFDQLAKQSLAQRLGLLAVLVLLVLAVYYQFFFTEQSEQRERLDSQQRSLLSQQKKLDADLEEMLRLEKVYAELQQSIRDNQRALPSEAELPAFFDHLQRKAVDAGVTIRSWERLKEEAVDMYVRVPVKVDVVGSFAGIMKYFYLLGPPQGSGEQGSPEGLRINERIVSIAELSLGSPMMVDGQLQLTARFIASTFRQAALAEGEALTPSAELEQILEKGGVERSDDASGTPARDGAGNSGGAR